MMIKLIPIEVECHSGFKADEYPKYFFWNNSRFEISQITDRWYQGENNPEYPISNYFKILAKSDEQFIIKHDLESDKWYLCR